MHRIFEAIEDYSMALSIEPAMGDARIRRGFARGYQEDWRGAAEDFSKVLEDDPEHARALSERFASSSTPRG